MWTISHVVCCIWGHWLIAPALNTGMGYRSQRTECINTGSCVAVTLLGEWILQCPSGGPQCSAELCCFSIGHIQSDWENISLSLGIKHFWEASEIDQFLPFLLGKESLLFRASFAYIHCTMGQCSRPEMPIKVCGWDSPSVHRTTCIFSFLSYPPQDVVIEMV